MVNYQDGKIYKVVCNITGLVYIGSTTKQYLSQRLTTHLCNYRKFLNGKYSNISINEILKNGNYSIILLKLCPCDTKDMLLMEERKFIETIDCVNIQRPIVPKEEKKEEARQRRKTYWKENIEVIKEKQKVQILCDCGHYYRVSDKSKHMKSNKHLGILRVMPPRKTDRILCECGIEYTHRDKARHFKTKSHMEKIGDIVF